MNLSEERMERKQEHCELFNFIILLWTKTNDLADDQVVKAFENALALLRSQ